ncbi:hypothetical protein [Jiangella asiatica]|uniref:Uncharacterized protein n=1 Tax=Jiangella asiatica TaxID=2530372 RepID=A0A4R5CI60_9ACTN|nr:hypothetical protein [Jiangella asiatica]TDD99918.1 hypothetical protein E1269_27050 [Jiangella asiatica]
MHEQQWSPHPGTGDGQSEQDRAREYRDALPASGLGNDEQDVDGHDAGGGEYHCPDCDTASAVSHQLARKHREDRVALVVSPSLDHRDSGGEGQNTRDGWRGGEQDQSAEDDGVGEGGQR